MLINKKKKEKALKWQTENGNKWTSAINKVIKSSIGLGKEQDGAKPLSADYLATFKDIKNKIKKLI